MRKTLSCLSLILFIVGCGANHGSGDAGDGPRRRAEQMCRNIVTDASIKNFHQKQQLYRVYKTGASVHCESQVDVNGNGAKVVVDGTDRFGILPRLEIIGVERTRGTWVVHAM